MWKVVINLTAVVFLSLPSFCQPKDTVQTMMGVFFYKDGTTLYIMQPQRGIIAQMNNRYTRMKLDSAWLCNRSQNVLRPSIKKKYIFK